MKKNQMTLTAGRLVLAIVFCSTTTVMMANPVSPSTARETAAKFLKTKGAMLKNEAMRAPLRVMGRPADNQEQTEANPFYVFNAAASQGFVIVSGDDCVGDNLVLGYTERGSFDANDVPANMQSWLDGMVRQIAELSSLGLRAKAIAIHEDVDTLLTSSWGQGDNNYNPVHPYNAFCPVTDDKLCYTGCMATALSQVMYYHRWPIAVEGPLPTYKMANGRVIDELPSVTFDWDNMLDYYQQATTEVQQAAVATLMRYCGQSVQMDYTPWVSNGLLYDLDMLVTKFGYDPDVRLAHANCYRPGEWDQLLYDELREGRPLVYTGLSTGGGHAFVIDGYQANDGTGYFHVNWGWDGGFNGYFKLSLLQPGGSGTGASTTSDGYNDFQTAIIGLKPASKPLENYGRYVSGFEWNVFDLDQPNIALFWNTSCTPGTFSIALAERADDGTIDCTRLYNEESMQFGGYSFATRAGYVLISLADVTVEGLEPGSHNLVYVNKEAGTNAPWREVFGPNCYLEVIAGEDGQTSETLIHPMPKLAANSRYLLVKGLKQWGVRHDVTATITNSGEDFVGAVDCSVYAIENGKLVSWVHDSKTGIMMESGGTENISFAVSFPHAGEYMVVLSNRGETEDITGSKQADIKKVKGYIGHKVVSIAELGFYCQDVVYKEVPGQNGNVIGYFTIQLANRTSWDYDAALVANIYRPNDEGVYKAVSFNGSEQVYTFFQLASNTTGNAYIQLPETLEPGDYYIHLSIANDFHSLMRNDYFVFAGGPFIIDSTVDIGRIENGVLNNENVVYDLQGRRMDNGQSSMVNGQLRKGLYIKGGKKIVVK